MNHYLVIILLLLISSCWTKYEEEDYLLNSKSSLIMKDGEHTTGYYVNRDSFIKPYTNFKYFGDTLEVTTVHEINSCAKTEAKIKFSNDTLYLLTEVKGNEVCSSVEFHKFSYTIKKNKIQNYHVSF